MAEIKAKVVLILWTNHIKHYWKVQSRYRSKNIYGHDINLKNKNKYTIYLCK
jgi:hypothetical protein